MSQSDTAEVQIGDRITGEKKTWGATFRTEAWGRNELVQVGFTNNELAKMLIFASDGLAEALNVLSFEAKEMEKEEAAKETPA